MLGRANRSMCDDWSLTSRRWRFRFIPRSFSSIQMMRVDKPPSSSNVRNAYSPFFVQYATIAILSVLWGGTVILCAHATVTSGRHAKSSAGQTVSNIDRDGHGNHFCLGHVAYGERSESPSYHLQLSWKISYCNRYLELGTATASNKREYARQNRYTFVPIGAQDYECLLIKYCPSIAAEARLADPITGAKFCAMRYALAEQGCDWMLLTDVDSVVIDTSVRIEDLIGSDAALLPTGDAIPDVIWFVDWSIVSNAQEDTEKEAHATGIVAPCGDVALFAASLNMGAFLMRRSTFTSDLLTHNVLALSSMGASFLTESDCSTAGLGATGEDLCASNSGVEECSIGCIHRMHPDWLEKAQCLSTLPTDVPAVLATFNMAPPYLSGQAGGGTLLANCIGSVSQQDNMDCIKYALKLSLGAVGNVDNTDLSTAGRGSNQQVYLKYE